MSGKSKISVHLPYNIIMNNKKVHSGGWKWVVCNGFREYICNLAKVDVYTVCHICDICIQCTTIITLIFQCGRTGLAMYS